MPLDGGHEQNDRMTATAGEGEGAMGCRVAALRHLELYASDLPVPRGFASKAGKDLEWITAAESTRARG